MTPTIWDSIAYTPWWVFLLYLYFIYAGYAAIQSRFIPYKSLRTMALYFFVATIGCLIVAKQFTLTNLLLWSAALCVGTMIGWVQFRLMRIKAGKNNDTLHIPGNWLIMPVVIAAIYAQYQHGFGNYLNLDFLRSQQFLRWLPPVYGLLSGLFIGKTIYSKHCIQRGPWVT